MELLFENENVKIIDGLETSDANDVLIRSISEIEMKNEEGGNVLPLSSYIYENEKFFKGDQFKSIFMLDKETEEVIGFSFYISEENDKKSDIIKFNISDKFKRKQYGTLLLRHLLKQEPLCELSEINLLILKDNISAIKLCEKFEFEVSDEDTGDSDYVRVVRLSKEERERIAEERAEKFKTVYSELKTFKTETEKQLRTINSIIENATNQLNELHNDMKVIKSNLDNLIINFPEIPEMKL